MFKHKDKKKTTILVVSSIVVLLIIGCGIFFWKSRNKKEVSNNNSNNLPSKKPDNNPKDKDLAEKIKNDLQSRLERVKNGSQSLEDLMPYVIDSSGKKIICNFNDLNFIKEGEEIFSNDIGEEKFQSIINLIKQIRLIRKEWEEKRKQKFQEKADANPNLFYFATRASFEPGLFRDETTHWELNGRWDRKDYKLAIPILHPGLANVQIKTGDRNLYLITGIENIPIAPSPLEGTGLFKIVKLSNQINIKLIEN